MMASFPWDQLKAETLRLVCKDLGAGSAIKRNRESMISFLINIGDPGCTFCLCDVLNCSLLNSDNIDSDSCLCYCQQLRVLYLCIKAHLLKSASCNVHKIPLPGKVM